MQSVPITTNVVSLNTTHGELYSIQQYTIMALGRGEYPKLSTPLGLFPQRALAQGK
jgi:hypothetical protein